MYALERFAQANPDHGQAVVNVICAYLRGLTADLPRHADHGEGTGRRRTGGGRCWSGLLDNNVHSHHWKKAVRQAGAPGRIFGQAWCMGGIRGAGANSEIKRLVLVASRIGTRFPAWDEPLGSRDAAVDELMGLALWPGSAGLRGVRTAVSRRQLPALYRFSVRVASRAATAGDPALCRAAIAAAVIVVWDEGDPREVMISVAPHHVAATRVSGQAAIVFDWAASQAPAELAGTLRVFGLRTDVTLKAFGWTEVTNPSGTWFARGR
jgi:hypothetical protein